MSKVVKLSRNQLRQIIDEALARDVPDFEVQMITKNYISSLKQLMLKWNKTNYVPDAISKQQEDQAMNESLNELETEIFQVLENHGFPIVRN